jgi:hypothetical protein
LGSGFDRCFLKNFRRREGRLFDHVCWRFLNRRGGSFGFTPRFFGLRNFYPAGAPTNNVGAHSTLYHGFVGFNFAELLVVGLNEPIDDDLFFTHVNLRLFLSGEGRPNASHLIILERALGFAPSHSQLIKLGNEIFGLHRQFFR